MGFYEEWRHPLTSISHRTPNSQVNLDFKSQNKVNYFSLLLSVLNYHNFIIV